MNELALFDAALALPDAAGRQAFLDAACAGDGRLRQRVDQLLAADGFAPGILDQDTADFAGAHRVDPGLAAGQCFAGRFTLGHKLGEGGMGEVWVADQTEPVRRQVAVKVIRAGLASARLLARFDQERQTLALMDHPNIGKVLDAGVADGHPYFVLELIPGVPIVRYCDDARLTPRQRLELFIPVCHAVQHAHQKGVIHRDLKPSNILVAPGDGVPVPKVIDFGIAKATGPRPAGDDVSTEVGTLVGTLEYMSPEQAEPNGFDIDTRSDIYALGVVLYELLTGGVPFPRQQLRAVPFAEMLRTLQEVEPLPPSRVSSGSGVPRSAFRVPRWFELDWIVMKCLAKDRARRYETAHELALDLHRYLADEPVRAGPPSARYRLRKFLCRHRGPVVAAALVVLTLVGGTVGTSVGFVRADRARRAEAERAEGERVARESAERRLVQFETGIDILGSLFEDLDPLADSKEGRPLRAILGDRLDAAAAALDGNAVGDPLVVARLQNRLGGSYLGLGHPAKAEALFTRAVAAYRTELGPDHRLTRGSLHNLALAYMDAGKVPAAIALFEQVRDARQAADGPDHPDTLAVRHSLGAAYWRADRPADAVALLEPVRDARVRDLGTTDLRTLATLDTLAGAYMGTGRRAEGIKLFQQVRDARLTANGPTHFHTLAALNNLARAYQIDGKMGPAIGLLEQVRNSLGQNLGAEHPRVLIVLDNLAWMYRTVRRFPEAIALAERVRDARLLHLGPYHPDTVFTLDNLGMTYRAAGQPDEALAAFERAAAGLEQLRFVNPGAARIVRNLGTAYEDRKQYDRAEPWRRKWLAVVREKDGPRSQASAQALVNLGTNLLRQDKSADAEPILREGLTLYQAASPGTWTTSDAQSLLGGALLGQKKYADAERMLVPGYQGMKTSEQGLHYPGPAVARRQTEALEWLVLLYDGWGKPADAAKWRKERAALKNPAEKLPRP